MIKKFNRIPILKERKEIASFSFPEGDGEYCNIYTAIDAETNTKHLILDYLEELWIDDQPEHVVSKTVVLDFPELEKIINNYKEPKTKKKQ
jgi:hypothetical protein